MLRGYLALVSGILIQTCIGGIYAWSVFVPALREEAKLSMQSAQLLFGACILVFTLSMIQAGRMLPRVGPRRLALAGGALYGTGFLVAAASGGSLPVLFLGVSLLSGAGIGLVYVCPIYTAIRWFPRVRGLVTGLAVGGFGGGAILLTNAADGMMGAGASVFSTFAAVGAGYLLLTALPALFLVLPPSAEEEGAQPASAADVVGIGVVKSRAFALLFGGMFCGTFAGLLVIGNLGPIGRGMGVAAEHCLTAISIFAVGNALGRVLWGWLYDRLRLASLPIALALIGVVTVGLALSGGWGWLFVVAAGASGLAFGACFVVFAGAVCDLFGPEGVARVYPLVFFGYGVSGLLGPTVGGWIFDRTGSYAYALVLSVALPLLASVLVYLFRPRDGGEGFAEEDAEPGPQPSRIAPRYALAEKGRESGS